jgi:hypothetical protein
VLSWPAIRFNSPNFPPNEDFVTQAATRKIAPGIEEVRTVKEGVLAMVIRRDFHGDKYNFPTPPDYALQLGINFYDAGETIKPHRHLPRPRSFSVTQEFITISDGEVILRLYDAQNEEVFDTILSTGDSVLLTAGHSFDVRRSTKITEVKLGPYDETQDKVRF